MRRLNVQRFTLATLCTLGLIAAGVGVVMYANSLSAVGVGLLTLVIREIGGGKASAYSWFFDGSADKPPPDPNTAPLTTGIKFTPAPPPT